MKTVYNASHFFKKGIALSLLIFAGLFAGLAAHANPSLHEAPPSLPLKGKVSSSASDCTYTLSAASNHVGAGAGADELTVTAGSSCVWTAASNVGWITVTSEASAIGSGNVSYSYTENTSLSSRTGTITIADETYTVTQAPAPDSNEDNDATTRATRLTAEFTDNASVIDILSVNCHTADDEDYYKIELDPGYTYTFSGELYDQWNPSEGGSSYTLDASISYLTSGSAWSAPNDTELVPAPVSGGILYLKIEPLSGAVGTYAAKIEIKRTGTAGCTYTLSPANKQATSAEGADEITVTKSDPSCILTAFSDVGWITIGSNTNTGRVTYSYLANRATASRTGHITIADQIYTVTQTGHPLERDTYEGNEGNNTKDKAYRFPAPTFTQNVGIVNILQASCLAGDVDYYKIELAAGYTYRLSGALYDLTNQNEGSNYTLNAQISYLTNGSEWSRAADSQLGPATVLGGTALYLRIEPSGSGTSRTGTYAAKIEIKRAAAAGCTYSLSPERMEATAPAYSGQVTVATGSSCIWTATSNVDWITITSGASAIGSGNVAYSYTENTSLYSRTGTITIADKTYTVIQARRLVPPDSYEPNNSKEEARVLSANFSPSLQPNASASIHISPASCHLTGDVDYYKIELDTRYTYTLNGLLYDLRNQNEDGNYTLDAKISYSTDNGSTWSAEANYRLSPKTMSGGTLYLRIEPLSSRDDVGTYAAKIDIRAGCRAFLPVLRKTVTSAAGSDQITAISGSSCPSWTAVSNADWLTFTGGERTAAGTGNLAYSYTANTTADLRTGTITIAGQVYTVTQAPPPDSYEPNNTPNDVKLPNSHSSLTPIFEQNTGVIRISPANCHVDDVDIYKINLEPGHDYTIRGTLYNLYNPQGDNRYTLDAQIFYSTDEGRDWGIPYDNQFSGLRVQGGNPLYLKISPPSSSEQKTGTYAAEININRTVPCTYTLSETNKQLASAAGSAEVTVTPSSSCTDPWEVGQVPPWITLTSSSSRTGTGIVTYSYTANTMWGTRTGRITIAGKPYTVTQMPPLIAPDSYEENNTAEQAAPLTAEFTNNASVIDILSASCHLTTDKDYYKIELEAGYTYTLSGTLYDLRNRNGGNYTLDAGISYSIDQGANWSNIEDTNLSSPETMQDGTFYLKIQPLRPGRVGTYAAKIEITRSPCIYAFSPASGLAPATGGTERVTVTTACSWEAVSNADWITLSQISGRGAATVAYSVAANTGEERTGTITLAGQTYTVTQEAAPCAYSFREATATLPASAGEGRTEITATGAACPSWTASCDAEWITVSPPHGTGTTAVSYSVTANTDIRRAGTITIAGQTHTVTQEAPSCIYSFREAAATFSPAASANGSTEIRGTGTSCPPWTASCDAEWITLNRTSGTGTTAVTYSVTANTGAERTGTITIAGKLHTVTQEAAPCAYFFREAAAEISAEASADKRAEIIATGGASCPSWTASCNADWITLSRTSGTGNTAVTYSVTANTGAERTGVITIARGQTHTVKQLSVSCTYSFRGATAAISAEAATDKKAEVIVTGTSCPRWEISSDADWITLSRNSGTVSTGVTYSVTANTGAERTGIITINGGATHTVTQAAGTSCAYSFRDAAAALPAAAADGSTEVVVTGTSCPLWTISSEADWITNISPTSGTVTTAVTYSVTENTGAERTGVITIAGGPTHTVTQAAASCIYSLSTSSEEVSAEASSGRTVEITSGESCEWEAKSEANWITNINPSSGRGNGTVTYSIAKNTGTERTGIITIAKKPYKVKQAGTVTGFEAAAGPAKIYPNPAKNFVTIDWAGKGAKCTSVKIANQFGQILYEMKNPERAVQFPLKGLAAGLYFILLQEEEKTAVQKLLVE